MRRRKWGLGSWGQGVALHFWLWSNGEEIAEVISTRGGFYVFFRGALLRDKPYASIGNAQLAAERRLRSEQTRRTK